METIGRGLIIVIVFINVTIIVNKPKSYNLSQWFGDKRNNRRASFVTTALAVLLRRSKVMSVGPGKSARAACASWKASERGLCNLES